MSSFHSVVIHPLVLIKHIHIIFLMARQKRQASSASAGIEEEIVIPPRIERGPTDILRALASTVGTDFTAPHYRYRYTVLYFPFESGDYLAKLSWLFSSNKILKIVLSYCF
jgi:hypothetical protein